MKTDDLVMMLARGAGPAPRAPALRRIAPVVVLGLMASIAAALLLLGPLPAAMYAMPALWLKLAYAAAVAIIAGSLTTRLARPVARLRAPRTALIAVFVVMAILALATLAALPPEQWQAAVLGRTWKTCSWAVLALSLPALAGALWALHGLAPTRPALAGFHAGLMAGGVGAVGYALSCSEVSTPYVAVWYTFGVFLAGGVGAVLGPRVLRW